MPTDQPALDKLLREAEETRLKQVALLSRGEEVLGHAKAVWRAIRKRTRQVTAPNEDGRTATPDLAPHLAEGKGPARGGLPAPMLGPGRGGGTAPPPA